MEFSFNYLGFTQFNTAHLKNIIEENWRKVWKYHRHENKIDSIVKPDHHDNEQHVREKTKKIELIQILLILVNQLAAYEILKVRFKTCFKYDLFYFHRIWKSSIDEEQDQIMNLHF